MLKTIPACIGPDLIHAMMSMGHGDELVLADADFPGPGLARRLIRADGVPLPALLEAVLRLMPLDPFASKPAITMDYHAWSANEPPSYAIFRNIIRAAEPRVEDFEYVERFAFYERARQAYAVVMTGEADGNLILKKGALAI